MSNIIQNVKLGFANIIEVVNIFISDDTNDSEGYDLYINGKDEEIAKKARELQQIEKQQENARISMFEFKPKAKTKSNSNSKKKYESTNVTKKESSRRITSDEKILDKEPEK